MPKLTMNLKETTPWTKVPNHLVDGLLPKLKDTELRILLVLLRASTGWHREGEPVILTYKELERRTGRHSDAISQSLKSLTRRGLIHKGSEPPRGKANKQHR